MHVQGIIKGKQIELPYYLGIPDGMAIRLDIQVLTPSFHDQQRLIDHLCGAWGDDPSIPEIFAEIDQQRHVRLF